MSQPHTYLFILLIILVLALVGFIFYTKRKQINLVDEIEQKLIMISNLRLNKDIKKIEKMELAGESLETLNIWKKRLHDLHNRDIPEINRLLSVATDLNAKYRLYGANKELDQASEKMDKAIEAAKNIRDIFTQLLESNKENQAQYEKLNKLYVDLRKNVLAHSYKYGVAEEQLEDNLSTMEVDFAESRSLSSQGDHAEAKHTLDSLQVKISEMQKQLPQIEEAQRQLHQVFQDQLRELKRTLIGMQDQGYAFSEDDLNDQIEKLYDELDQIDELLRKLQLVEANKRIENVKTQINTLYDTLAVEYKARPFVEKNQDKMLQLLNEAKEKSDALLEKVQHIDESYELTHGELDDCKQFVQTVIDMQAEYQADLQKIADKTAVYSKIKAAWTENIEDLKHIDENEKAMLDDLSGLYASENIANDSIASFKQEVSLVYRRMERRNLPGKPDGFLQMYTLVVNEIAKVSQELDQVRLNMEKISEELIQISDDVERLKREADEIINAANLVELTLQYSNKFSDRESMQTAQQEALDLYQNKYDYKNALDVIAVALEKAEPGSYQRLEQTYYTEHNNN
ncbi:MAG: septation ring formation regulator EzrA [Lactobacillus sp.]|nr:septation ring formation regulator EzrA [Lactobacillus sp.]